jgi:hypothetical protein
MRDKVKDVLEHLPHWHIKGLITLTVWKRSFLPTFPTVWLQRPPAAAAAAAAGGATAAGCA